MSQTLLGRAFRRVSDLMSPALIESESASAERLASSEAAQPAAPNGYGQSRPADHARMGRFFEFHVVQDLEGRWRWTLLTVTGHPLARSFYGYDHYFQCEEAIRRLQLADHRTPILRQ